jgi:hypothetical protein
LVKGTSCCSKPAVHSTQLRNLRMHHPSACKHSDGLHQPPNLAVQKLSGAGKTSMAANRKHATKKGQNLDPDMQAHRNA